MRKIYKEDYHNPREIVKVKKSRTVPIATARHLGLSPKKVYAYIKVDAKRKITDNSMNPCTIETIEPARAIVDLDKLVSFRFKQHKLYGNDCAKFSWEL